MTSPDQQLLTTQQAGRWRLLKPSRVCHVFNDEGFTHMYLYSVLALLIENFDLSLAPGYLENVEFATSEKTPMYMLSLTLPMARSILKLRGTAAHTLSRLAEAPLAGPGPRPRRGVTRCIRSSVPLPFGTREFLTFAPLKFYFVVLSFSTRS